MKKFIPFIVLLIFAFSTTSYSQSGKMAIGANLTIDFPMGDFGDVANTGFGGMGYFYYGLNNNIDLTGSIGYITFGSDNDNLDFSDVPFLVGARYYFKRAEFTPYASGELGLHFTSFEYEAPSFFGFGGGTQSTSDTEFGASIGGGFLYMLNKNLDLDVNAKFHLVSDANQFTIQAGIRYGVN